MRDCGLQLHHVVLIVLTVAIVLLGQWLSKVGRR